jgi:hypothetical protein
VRLRDRGVLATSAAAVALAAAGCGGGDETSDRPDPFEAVEQSEQTSNQQVRSEAAPRWERVASLNGSGAATEAIRIEPDAIQWRVRWRCSEGDFQISQTPTPDEGNPIGSGPCEGEGEAEAIDTGDLELRVQTPGRWEGIVEQQVTDPIAEPPLAEMEADDAEVVASGDFYPVEKRGRGRAVLHELPTGRLALRLEGFGTLNNTDLFVWLSEARRPRTTRQALRSDYTELALLKSTIGDQNYLLPEDVDVESIASIVIWCEPVRIAYTAATLDP